MENTKYIEALHLKMHETFKETIEFLESHNLKWYCSAGTALGAVRHHDFIPWDDDIDIYMPRADYNILLSLKEEVNSSNNLELINIDDEGYTQWFAKFVDKHSTTFESFDIPIIYGVWVDVFPLDFSSNSIIENTNISSEYRKLFLKYQLTVLPNSFKLFLYELSKLRFKRIFDRLINSLFTGRKQFLKDKFKDFDKSIQTDKGDYLVSYCEGGRILNCDWFKSSEWVDFNNYKVRIPCGYDEYLRSVFGNYMELPPVDKRVTHQMKYVNLGERLTKDEIVRRIRSGESFIA